MSVSRSTFLEDAGSVWPGPTERFVDHHAGDADDEIARDRVAGIQICLDHRQLLRRQPVLDLRCEARDFADRGEMIDGLEIAAVVPAVEAGLVPAPARTTPSLETDTDGSEIDADRRLCVFVR